MRIVSKMSLFFLFVLTSTAFAHPLIDVSISDGQYRKVYDFLDRMVAKKAIGGI